MLVVVVVVVVVVFSFSGAFKGAPAWVFHFCGFLVNTWLKSLLSTRGHPCNRIYNKILARDWFSARLFAT